MQLSAPSRQPVDRRSVLILLAAMFVALLAGMLAWGPIEVVRPSANTTVLAPIPTLVNLVAWLTTLLAACWGWHGLVRGPWSHCVRRPWSWFFVLSALSTGLAAMYLLEPDDTRYAFSHALVAAASLTLLLGFLSELVHPRFGSVYACAAAIGTAGAAVALSWIASSAQGTSDLRALLLLQILPVLLVPAGILSVRDKYVGSRNCLVVLSLYALAQLFAVFDASILQASTGWIGSGVLMHLFWAAVTAWLAWRCNDARSAKVQGVFASAESAQRSTSSNTSS